MELKPVQPPWKDGIAWMCRKCGEKLRESTGAAENPVVAAKDRLKSRLKTEGRWISSRVVLTECMDICPVGQVAVAVGKPGAAIEVLTCDLHALDQVVELL